MKKAYAINNVKITDPEKFQEYIVKVKPILEKYEAKVIVSDTAYEVLEGTLNTNKNIIIEFDNKEKAIQFYNNEDYIKNVKPLRLQSTDTKVSTLTINTEVSSN